LKERLEVEVRAPPKLLSQLSPSAVAGLPTKKVCCSNPSHQINASSLSVQNENDNEKPLDNNYHKWRRKRTKPVAS